MIHLLVSKLVESKNQESPRCIQTSHRNHTVNERRALAKGWIKILAFYIALKFNGNPGTFTNQIFQFLCFKFGLFTQEKIHKNSLTKTCLFFGDCVYFQTPWYFLGGSVCLVVVVKKILLNRTNFHREKTHQGSQTARGRFQPQEGHDVTFSETHFVGLMKRGWCSALALMSCLQSARRFATHHVRGNFQGPNAPMPPPQQIKSYEGIMAVNDPLRPLHWGLPPPHRFPR